MKKNTTLFEKIKEIDKKNGNEFWSARKLANALGYREFRNFAGVIEKAREACENSKHKASDHFVQVNEMVWIGSGARRMMENLRLSRYACYLIVQNSDPSKTLVAEGQTYFAVQTRLQEIKEIKNNNILSPEEDRRLFLRNELKRHNTQLASVAKQAGVIETKDYAIFQNHGYKGLYNGLDAKAIHETKRLKKSQQILDHMGSTELAANLFRTTQTEEKLKLDQIVGKRNANKTHYDVGVKVRKIIAEIGGKMPEDLPSEVSIKKLEKKENKKLITQNNDNNLIQNNKKTQNDQ